jgi:carboxypeptidase T
VDPGASVTLTANADDDLYNNSTGKEPTQAINTARYSIDSPSWVEGTLIYPVNASDGNFNSTNESLQAEIDTTHLIPGQHIIFVEAMDADGNWGVPSAIFLKITGLSHTLIPLILNNH